MGKLFHSLLVVLTFVAFGSLTTPACAYSLLTHEQLIDLTWQDSIVPLLQSRYPNLTVAQLQRARAYAYGGSAIQDIGYYPFGDAFLSELTHYVRTGDFVAALFRNAHDANELAFAIGALSHYIGDTVGHAEATNRAVPVEFPNLGRVFGPVVTYAEDERAHVRTEFAFDINEITHHRLAPLRYLRQVGLQVPTTQLAAAVYQTYGIGQDLSKTRSGRINVRGYRFAVRTLLPRIAYAVTLLHRDGMPPDGQTPEFGQLQSEAARVSSENNWQHFRRKPGIGTYSLAGLIFILPKVGPLKLVSIKGPRADTDAEYVRSVNLSTVSFRAALGQFGSHGEGVKGSKLENRDLDTGEVVRPGSYKLTDETYAALLHRLAAAPTVPVPSGIKDDILEYYSDAAVPTLMQSMPLRWAHIEADLRRLKTMPVSDQPPAATATR